MVFAIEDPSLFQGEEIFFSDAKASFVQKVPSLEGMPREGLLKPKKIPSLACALSLVPGLGHYYLGENQTANALFAGALVGGSASIALKKDAVLFDTSFLMLRSVQLYGMFAAYRDAKLLNGEDRSFLPRDTFADLSSAPFRWSVMKKPEVSGALAWSLLLALTSGYFVSKNFATLSTKYVEPLSALPIAIGEESLFRGSLQSALMERYSPGTAITLSSLFFGLAHIPNAGLYYPKSEMWRYYTFSLPLITALGGYMGWLTYKNHSLKESVALHAWYDFVLMGLSLVGNEASLSSPKHFGFSLEF